MDRALVIGSSSGRGRGIVSLSFSIHDFVYLPLIIYIEGKSDEARWFHIGSALNNIHGYLASFTWAELRRMLERMHK